MSPAVISQSLDIIKDTFQRYRAKQLELAGNAEYQTKRDGSFVTALDFEIEKAVQHVLTKTFPAIPVFGEESGYESNPSSAFWLIDPIDGTKSFIDGTPTFTNMAVLIENKTAIASIIYNPTRNEMYVAQKGKGAYRNDKLLNIRNLDPPRTILCKEMLIQDMRKILSDDRIIYEAPPSGGGNGFTMIADGLISARFQLHASGFTHDYAPGALLVRESGGVIIPINTDTYTYESRSFVACHPYLEDLIWSNIDKIRDLEK